MNKLLIALLLFSCGSTTQKISNENKKTENSIKKVTITPQQKKEIELVSLIRKGDVSALQAFLAKDTSLQTEIPFDSAIIPIAVTGGNIEIVSLLLSKGAFVNQFIVKKNNFVDNGLSLTKDPSIAKLLEDSGAVDYNRFKQKLELEIHNGQTSKYMTCLQTMPFNSAAPMLMYYAGLYHRAWHLNYLIEKGASINAQEYQWGQTALFGIMSDRERSSDCDSLSTMLAIVKKAGVDINVSDNEGLTVLNYALFSNNREKVKMVLSLGADINKPNGAGNSPLLQLFVGNSLTPNKQEKAKRLETAKELIKMGASVKDIDSKRNTLINHAVRTLDTNFIADLIAKGVDPKIGNNDGYTPIANAIMQIRNYPENNSSVIKMVRILLDNGCDITKFDEKMRPRNYNPLYYVAYFNISRDQYSELCKMLIDAGAKVNGIDDNKSYAHVLIPKLQDTKNVKIFEMLLAAGLDVNSVDSEGKTPLDYIINPSKKEALVTYLREKGLRNGSELNVTTKQ